MKPAKLGTPFTDFYSKYIYAILIAVGLTNVAIAGLSALYPGKTVWALLLGTMIFLLGIPLVFYSFVEDKARIGFKKKIITLCVTLIIPVLQIIMGGFKDSNYESRSIITNQLDIVKLTSATAIVKANEYRNNEIIEKDARPALQQLFEKYPYNRDVLLALGIAQFETHRFDEAAETFEKFVELFPTDFKGNYHLGISLKLLASEQERKEGARGNKIAVIAKRRVALNNLLEATNYYESALEGEDYYWWRLARNIGWLYYEMSDKCKDLQLCKSAIEWHVKAIDGYNKFKGNQTYVLAFSNLGEIYRSLGVADVNNQTDDFRKSYEYLWKGLDTHQIMLIKNTTDAKDRDNRYVYSSLAKFLAMDGCKAGALRIMKLGMRTFKYDNQSDPTSDSTVEQLQHAVKTGEAVALARRPADCESKYRPRQ